MCDLDDYGNACRAWSEKVRVARKEHKCCACDETIAVGQHYHFASGVWSDSGPDSFKHCARCWAMYLAVNRRMRAKGEMAVITLDCGEVWENPPDEIAALAFALPGEAIDDSLAFAMLGEVSA